MKIVFAKIIWNVENLIELNCYKLINPKQKLSSKYQILNILSFFKVL